MSSKFYHQFKKDPNITNPSFDETTDLISYEEMLKEEGLSEEFRKSLEKLKLDRDRKLIQDKLDKLKINNKK